MILKWNILTPSNILLMLFNQDMFYIQFQHFLKVNLVLWFIFVGFSCFSYKQETFSNVFIENPSNFNYFIKHECNNNMEHGHVVEEYNRANRAPTLSLLILHVRVLIASNSTSRMILVHKWVLHTICKWVLFRIRS